VNRKLNASRQFVEQRLGVLQDRRVEIFGEPAVYRREEIAGFGPFALIAPEAGEVQGRTQLPESGALLLRHCRYHTVYLCERREKKWNHHVGTRGTPDGYPSEEQRDALCSLPRYATTRA
jgi:hypothetical protein